MGNAACLYCKDTGQIRTKGREREARGRVFYEEDAKPCVCVLNKFISDRFEPLGSISDATPNDAILAAKRYSKDTYKDLKIEDRDPGKRFEHRNLIMHGNESYFYYILKSYLLFFYKFHTFEFMDGLQIVQHYYVEQPEGEHRSLYDLNAKDLMVISFTSKPNNSALHDVVLEVIKNRHNLNKATWIYSETPQSLLTSKEYTEALNQYIKDFPRCNIESKFEYEGYGAFNQASKVDNKKDISKKLATDFNL